MTMVAAVVLKAVDENGSGSSIVLKAVDENGSGSSIKSSR